MVVRNSIRNLSETENGDEAKVTRVNLQRAVLESIMKTEADGIKHVVQVNVDKEEFASIIEDLKKKHPDKESFFKYAGEELGMILVKKEQTDKEYATLMDKKKFKEKVYEFCIFLYAMGLIMGLTLTWALKSMWWLYGSFIWVVIVFIIQKLYGKSPPVSDDYKPRRSR